MIPAQEEGISESKLDKTIRLLTQMGLSTELILSQLITAGHPLDALRTRFPDAAETVFQQTQPRRVQIDRLRPLIRTSEQETRAVATLSASTSLPARPTVSPGSQACARAAVDLPNEGISFQYVPLIQCSFPHGDPGELVSFTRRNGWLELTLATNQPRTGLPYGVPARLLTIYCASEAIRNRSREIYLGDSVHDFLRRLEIPITRGERGSLRVYANQLLRLIHCSVSIDEHIQDGHGRAGLHIRQALFAEEAKLWWDDADGVGQGSSMVLSQTLFESILRAFSTTVHCRCKSATKKPDGSGRVCVARASTLSTWQAQPDQVGATIRAVRTWVQ